jgi:hypothetical protein
MDKKFLSNNLLSFGITSVVLNPALMVIYQRTTPVSFMLTGAGAAAIVAALLVRKVK